MKKRIVSLFLIIVLCLESSMMLFATESQERNIEQESVEETETAVVEAEQETGISETIPESVDQEDVTLKDIEVITDVSITPTAVNEEFDSSEVLDELGEVTYSQGIMIDGSEYDLYPEFQDADSALGVLKEDAEEALTTLKNNYNLEDLSNDNYEEYQDCVALSLESEEIQENEKIEKEMIMINQFLDIYENSSANEEILEVVDTIEGNLEGTPILEAAEIVNELQELVPYNTGIEEALDEVIEEIMVDIEDEYDISSEELNEMYEDEYGISSEEPEEVYQENLVYNNQDSQSGGLIDLSLGNVNQQIQQLTYSKNSNFNVAKGVAYANKYAVNQNTYFRYFKNADCTNFVSQIKRAGGVADYFSYLTGGSDSTFDYDKSWCYIGYHSYGKRWTVADRFAKFFGVKYTTTNFYTFSTKVKKGSFISYDITSDGSWDHMAFVTAKSSTKKTTEGVTYYDFKVAQHTTNYNYYVSNSKNSWEKLKKSNPKVKLGIIN